MIYDDLKYFIHFHKNKLLQLFKIMNNHTDNFLYKYKYKSTENDDVFDEDIFNKFCQMIYNQTTKKNRYII